MKLSTALLSLGLATTALSSPAFAQAQQEEAPPKRIRVALGAQLVPSFPGADRTSVRPLVDVARTTGDDPFDFEAADESFGFRIADAGGFSFGPVVGFEGRRRAQDVGGLAPVKFSVEPGGFVQYELDDAFRLRAEVRKGMTGHNGLIANLGADAVVRDGDKYLFSVGPRVTFTDDRYNRAYFGVTSAGSAASGLPVYTANGELQAIGGTAGLVTQLNDRFGLYSYAKYDRLVGDAGRSPVVRAFGSRNQFSGGLALTYTFVRR